MDGKKQEYRKQSEILAANPIRFKDLSLDTVKADFNTFQIGDMAQLNSFVGSLVSSAVTYGMTGNVTFNLAKLSGKSDGQEWSTGILEMNLGSDGFSMGIGAGGTDISLGTIAGAARGAYNWNKNIRIEKAAKENEVTEAATSLRAQWGFGDKAALAQLDSILKGETLLRAREGGDSEAQTVLENGKRVVYLDNYTSGMSREQKLGLGITLQHEAYRDGIVNENNSMETLLAATGHTRMALRMADDPRYKQTMASLISGNVNLQNDITAYVNAKMKGDDSIFSNYVNANYDSSADYWRLMEDGSLLYDGDGFLKDSKGYFILDKNKNKIGQEAVEGGLAQILGISNEEAAEMMRDAGMTEKEENIWWKHSGNEGKSITLTNEKYAGIYNASLIQYNTFEIYKELLAAGRMTLSANGSIDKYISYEEYKENNFTTGGASYQSRNTFEGEEITTFIGATGNISINPHRGADTGVNKQNSFLLFGNDTSRVEYSSADSEENKKANMNEPHGLHATIATEISYIFKGELVTDTVYFRSLHLDEVLVKSGDTVSWDKVIGITGNTGKWVTPDNPDPDPYPFHAHEEIYTQGNKSPYLDLLTKIRNATPVISYGNKYYYDKFIFADKNKYKYDEKKANDYSR